MREARSAVVVWERRLPRRTRSSWRSARRPSRSASLCPDVEAGDALVEPFEFGPEFADFPVDVVSGYAAGLPCGDFRIEVEPPFGFVGERHAATAERPGLFFLAVELDEVAHTRVFEEVRRLCDGEERHPLLDHRC